MTKEQGEDREKLRLKIVRKKEGRLQRRTRGGTRTTVSVRVITMITMNESGRGKEAMRIRGGTRTRTTRKRIKIAIVICVDSRAGRGGKVEEKQ